MSTLTEGNYALGFIISHLPGKQSFENGTLLSGQNLKAGDVLGRLTFGAAIAAAIAGNTGNGTASAVTVAAPAKVGVYKVLFIEPTTNLGTFLVEDPDGIVVGRGVVGTAFALGGLGFTISDGATDFVAGDGFTITIAAGSLKWAQIDPEATNGTQVAAGILCYDTDASGGDKVCAILTRGAEVNNSELGWSDLDAGELTAAKAQLAALNPPILVRTGI